MKKFFSVALFIVMLFALCIPTFAEGIAQLPGLIPEDQITFMDSILDFFSSILNVIGMIIAMIFV